MKIKKSPLTFSTAQQILACLKGEAPAEDFNVSLSNGHLVFNSNAHPLGDDETVLIPRLDLKSMGDDWDDADPIDVIDFLQDHYA